ncbi:DUF3999 family protein [Viridibacterium curvum]|uniref:DUF3999 domain-containing protein n=1 Tax=Viridibacterium curvum TaxID=1101404 RepID=A0ABP9QZ97_9RHOO
MTRAARHAAALLALSLLPVLTHAATALQPADFATGRVLRVEGNAPFYRITLPPDLYTSTAYPDLRDLRVFNGQAEALPFALVQPPGRESAARSISLRSFKLVSQPAQSDTPRVELVTPGVRLQVAQAGSKTTAAEYLLTAHITKDGPPPSLTSLHLEWEASGNWQQRVSVEGSHDLKYWTPVAQDQPVMDLQNGSQRFVQADIPFGYAADFPYWRLRFDQGEAPGLREVTAQLATERTPAPPVSIAASPLRGGQNGDGSALYQLPAAVQFSALRILPMEPNSVLPLRIETRADEKSAWLPWASSVAYRLAGPQGERRSAAIQGPTVVARELRLVPVGPGWGSLAPAVQAERSALELVFNARGSGPWLLAWGSRAATDASLPLDTLQTGKKADDIDTLPHAIIGATETLGGAERLTAPAPAEKQQRWRTALVWVALIAGAAALARLAFSVWKQTRAA